tara:strand:+ start:657 stop:1442 length:786 start_codon:yes stop_codon:yes gene_type:complete
MAKSTGILLDDANRIEGPINQVIPPVSSSTPLNKPGKPYNTVFGFDHPQHSGLELAGPDQSVLHHSGLGKYLMDIIQADPNRYEDFYDVYSDFYDHQALPDSHYDDLSQVQTIIPNDGNLNYIPLSDDLKRTNFENTINNLEDHVFATYPGGSPGKMDVSKPGGLYSEFIRRPDTQDHIYSVGPDTSFIATPTWRTDPEAQIRPPVSTMLHESILHGSGARHGDHKGSHQHDYDIFEKRMMDLLTEDEINSLMDMATHRQK